MDLKEGVLEITRNFSVEGYRQRQKFDENLLKKKRIKSLSYKKKDKIEYSLKKGKWNKEEHNHFLQVCLKYGNNWPKIQEVLKSRTCAQIRSHAQKFIIKLCKKYQIKIKSKKFRGKSSRHLNFVYKKKIVNPRPIDPDDKKFLDLFNYYRREEKIFLIEKVHKNHDEIKCPFLLEKIRAEKKLKNTIWKISKISNTINSNSDSNVQYVHNQTINSCDSYDYFEENKFDYENNKNFNINLQSDLFLNSSNSSSMKHQMISNHNSTSNSSFHGKSNKYSKLNNLSFSSRLSSIRASHDNFQVRNKNKIKFKNFNYSIEKERKFISQDLDQDCYNSNNIVINKLINNNDVDEIYDITKNNILSSSDFYNKELEKNSLFEHIKLEKRINEILIQFDKIRNENNLTINQLKMPFLDLNSNLIRFTKYYDENFKELYNCNKIKNLNDINFLNGNLKIMSNPNFLPKDLIINSLNLTGLNDYCRNITSGNNLQNTLITNFINRNLQN